MNNRKTTSLDRWRKIIMTVSYLFHGHSSSVVSAASTSSSKTHLAFHTLNRLKQKRVNRESEQRKPFDAPRQPEQHLVLIGGGHAHVQVIKALNAAARPEHLKVTLIDAQKSASYSGMVPGCIAGQYTPEETQLRLQPLAEWAGMTFVHDRVVDVDLDRKLIYLQGMNCAPDEEPEPIPFDAVSIDIGSTSRGFDTTPGAAAYTIPTRPIDKLIQRLDLAREELLLEESSFPEQQESTPPHLVVIGGGAAGIELSMAVTTRWQEVRPDMTCTLLDTGKQLLPAESEAARRTLARILDEKNISVRHNSVVQEITGDAVVLTTGESIPYSHCIWATGAGAHPLARHLQTVRGLDCTKHGWIRVGPTMQSTSHPFVFAAGDCASIESLENGSPPKAGVFAVRAGPILIENLTRYLNSLRGDAEELTLYEPQTDFLKLLVCGNGKAIGFRFGMVLYGKWVFQLKDHIDQNFMKLFEVSGLPKPETPASGYDTSQYDANDKDTANAPTASEDPLQDPEEAAVLLHRTDEDVDYQKAWRVIREMAKDEVFREAVLEHAHDLTVSLR